MLNLVLRSACGNEGLPVDQLTLRACDVFCVLVFVVEFRGSEINAKHVSNIAGLMFG